MKCPGRNAGAVPLGAGNGSSTLLPESAITRPDPRELRDADEDVGHGVAVQERSAREPGPELVVRKRGGRDDLGHPPGGAKKRDSPGPVFGQPRMFERTDEDISVAVPVDIPRLRDLACRRGENGTGDREELRAVDTREHERRTRNRRLFYAFSSHDDVVHSIAIDVARRSQDPLRAIRTSSAWPRSSSRGSPRCRRRRPERTRC